MRAQIARERQINFFSFCKATAEERVVAALGLEPVDDAPKKKINVGRSSHTLRRDAEIPIPDIR